MTVMTPAGVDALRRYAEAVGIDPALLGINPGAVPANPPASPHDHTPHVQAIAPPKPDVTARSALSTQLYGTRPYDQAEAIIEKLRECGFEIVARDGAGNALPTRVVWNLAEGESTIAALRRVADRLEKDQHVGGSSVRRCVSAVLRDVADVYEIRESVR